MASEPQAIGQTSAFERLQARIAARNVELVALSAWEKAHPGIAADWNEANAIEAAREDVAGRAQRDADVWQRSAGELRKLGVPLDAIDATGKPDENEATGSARAFLDSDPVQVRFLLLMGKKGTGKTVAAALVLRKAAADFVRARNNLPSGGGIPELSAAFVLASTFARISGYAADDKAWFEQLCAVRVLVLDDFGAEHLGPFAAGMLDEMLTRRHGSRLRTVITSNLGKPELRARMGERLYDRISTSCIACVLVGESLRKRWKP